MRDIMKLTVNRNTLLDALQLVSGVVEKRHTLPILSNILFSVKNKQVKIVATDTEVELIAKCDLETVDEPCDITIPARKLTDIFKSLPDNAIITMTWNKDRLKITHGRSRFVLSTLNPAEFPAMDQFNSTMNLSIEQRLLKKLLTKTYFSMAHQDVRYFLNGLLFDIAPNQLRIVGTDGHRLSLASLNMNVNTDKNLQIIVPRKGILELIRLLGDDDTVLQLSISTNHIQVNTDQFVFTSKLIDGKFPDFNRVIPKKLETVLDLHKEEFKGALQRTAILCNEKFHGVKLNFKEKMLDLSAHNPEQEESVSV